MKTVVALISIYFFMLTVIPCHWSITNTGNTKSKVKISMTSPTNNHDETSNQELDLCTPFCPCGNYPNYFVKQNTLELTLIEQPIAKKIPTYTESKTTFFTGSLLRPPQA